MSYLENCLIIREKENVLLFFFDVKQFINTNIGTSPMSIKQGLNVPCYKSSPEKGLPDPLFAYARGLNLKADKA